MVTGVPVAPLLGVNMVMIGAGMKVKSMALVAVPPGVVTVIAPVSPVPTVALICVSLTVENFAAAVPPNATAVAPVKSLP